MTAAILPSEVSIPQKDKRIRVQYCIGGFAMMPHNLLREKRFLSRSQANVFEVVWEDTVSHNDFRWPISMERLIEETGLSKRSIQSASKWLKENGWLTIEERRSESNIYGIPEELLEKHGCLKSSEKELNEGNCTPPSLKGFKERKKKEIPKPTLMVATTGPSKEVAKVRSGSFQVIKTEDSQIVREMIVFGVNRTIIEKAMRKKGKEWVGRIYEEFNTHVGKANNINSGPAVLASRLQDYDETWRKVFDKPPGSRELLTEMSPAMVEKWQDIIDKQFTDADGKPDDMPFIFRDCAKDAGVPFTVVEDTLDSRGMEVAL